MNTGGSQIGFTSEDLDASALNRAGTSRLEPTARMKILAVTCTRATRTMQEVMEMMTEALGEGETEEYTTDENF
jgi:hypothetical protein